MENDSLNRWHLGAAALMAFTTFVHTFAGGPEIYTPVRASDSMTPELISVLSVVWHIVTSHLALMAPALYWLARAPNLSLANVLLLMNIAYIALFVGYSIADFGNVTTMPQWTLFFAISAFIVLGQRRRT